LHGLQQAQQQSEQREKIETLGQWVTEVTQDIIRAPNASTLYTMYLITRIARMVLRITDEHSAKLGLSQSKLAALMYLSSEPEQSASPSALAKHCGISRPAMTGLLNGLEQEGYVERDNDPFDRRALTVQLTAKGQQFLDWIAPQDQDQLSKLMDTFDDGEREKFVNLAQQVLKLLEE
ncbi:MarR family transcriptional regulator, partial [Leptolyngbya sp. FACHB-36]|uniref:MarR family winged helix-turn-helix transcriptional regulator n=1 Tax=Leptolyngbya sp. FACHB-36 TaxID=2692808 RepID=UPI0016813EE2